MYPRSTLSCFFCALLILSCNPIHADDWQVLFDGKSFAGWQASRNNKQFTIDNETIVGMSSGQTHFLYTTEKYGDFELELEVKLHDIDLNSGIQIRTKLIRKNAKGQERASIHGPQVDLGKSPGRSGNIFNQGNGAWITPKEQLTRNELMANGEWNRVRIRTEGPRIRTWINDKQVADVTNQEIYKEYSQGVIALQVHGVKISPEKERHISFRSIRLRKLMSDN